jgi:hypothetical protein
MKVINNYSKPVVLDNGAILAAAGAEGSTKSVESISDRDRRRLVDRGLIAIVEESPKTPKAKEDNKQ